jgi:hypothetical protein
MPRTYTPTGNRKGRRRKESDDPVIEKRRARQRLYYWREREARLAYARQYYLESKPQLTEQEIREREQLKAERKAAAAERKRKHRQVKRADISKQHRRWLARLKLERGCVDCGYNEWPSALHFDHRPGETKSFEIGGRLYYAWERIMAEVDKCDVRCANCHHKVTDLRRHGVGVHREDLP